MTDDELTREEALRQLVAPTVDRVGHVVRERTRDITAKLERGEEVSQDDLDGLRMSVNRLQELATLLEADSMNCNQKRD